MAEETTSAIASPAPSTEQAPATSNTPQQPVQQASATTDKPVSAKVNLFEIPEFKQYQAQQNQLISRLQRQVQETEQQYQQRIANLETRDMDEGERNAYLTQQQLTQAQRERDEYAAYVQQMRADEHKRNVLSRVSRTTGVPIEELYQFDNADDAWEYGNKTALEREKAQLAAQQQAARREAASDVDLGGGAPALEDNPFDKARQAKNTLDFTRAYMERRSQRTT